MLSFSLYTYNTLDHWYPQPLSFIFPSILHFPNMLLCFHSSSESPLSIISSRVWFHFSLTLHFAFTLPPSSSVCFLPPITLLPTLHCILLLLSYDIISFSSLVFIDYATRLLITLPHLYPSMLPGFTLTHPFPPLYPNSISLKKNPNPKYPAHSSWTPPAVYLVLILHEAGCQAESCKKQL